MQQNLPDKPLNAQPLTVRLAMWSARHRWPVAGLWFVLIFGLAGFALGALGTRNRGLDAVGPASLESSKARAAFDEAGGADGDRLVVVVSHPTLKVTDPAYKSAVQDMIERVRATRYAENGQPQPSFPLLVDYYTTGNPALVSPDGSTTRFLGLIPGRLVEADKKVLPVRPVLKSIKEQYRDYTIYAFSTSLLTDDFVQILNHDLDGSLRITLPLTFLILLIAFGAVAAALVPLVLAMTALTASFSIMAIYSHVVEPIDSSVGQVIVLIGLAVGIDYSLFMITRYRAERRRGHSKTAALEVASSTAGRAVFFSGLTVMISLAGLLLMNDSTFNSMAIGTISVVLVSVSGSLTFLPATLAILGNGVNWGRLPYFGRERQEGSGVWSRIVHFVMARPLLFMVGLTALLLALAAPTLRMNLGVTSNTVSALPAELEYRKAVELMDSKWPQGSTLTMDVVVKADAANRSDVRAAIERFNAAALATPGLSGPVETTPAPNGKVVKLGFVLAGAADSQANKDLLAKMRQELIPAHFKSLPGVEVYVMGWTALTVDIVRYYLASMPLVLGFVLGLSFLLLLVAFHSIIIPVKAILLNMLSTGAAYGSVVLVFQDGYFSEQIGFKPISVVEGWLPIFLFTILFGLSMDYHLFVLTRIKEERDRGASSVEAVARGISVTSGTITSAAAIMVVVFAVFVTLQLMVVRQLGLGLAVAVFVDATIIRCALLPATMKLLGDWNWWLPGFLQWIPHVTIEGEAVSVSEQDSELAKV